MPLVLTNVDDSPVTNTSSFEQEENCAIEVKFLSASLLLLDADCGLLPIIKEIRAGIALLRMNIENDTHDGRPSKHVRN